MTIDRQTIVVQFQCVLRHYATASYCQIADAVWHARQDAFSVFDNCWPHDRQKLIRICRQGRSETGRYIDNNLMPNKRQFCSVHDGNYQFHPLSANRDQFTPELNSGPPFQHYRCDDSLYAAEAPCHSAPYALPHRLIGLLLASIQLLGNARIAVWWPKSCPHPAHAA